MKLGRPLSSLFTTVGPLALGAAAIAACQSGTPLPYAEDGATDTNTNWSSGAGDDCFNGCLEQQAVVNSDVPPPALSGGTLLILADGMTAVVSDPDRDRVLLVDLAKQAVRVEYKTPAGAVPGRAVEDASGVVHVVLRRGSGIMSFDPNASSAAIVTNVCGDPRGVATIASTNELVVACAGGELARLSAGVNPAVKSTTLLAPDLRDVVVTHDRLFVSHFRSTQLDVLSLDGDLIRSTFPPNYVGSSPFDINVPTHFSPTVAWRIIPALDGVLMVHQQSKTSMVIVDPMQGGGYGGFDCSSDIVHAEATLFDANGDVVNAPSAGGLSAMPLPVDVAVSHDGERVGMVAAALNLVTEMSPAGFLDQDGCLMNYPGFLVGGGGIPDGGSFGFPEVRFDQSKLEPVAIAYDGNDELVVQLREPAALEIHSATSGEVVATIDLGGEHRYDTGYLMFHADADAQPLSIACASCHPEGGEDGHTWLFEGFGARRTQSLAADVIGTEPFHWDGTLVDLGAVMSEVFVKRMGGIPQAPARVSALKGYLASFPDAFSVPAPDAAAVARGKVLFETTDVGCSTCHSGALLTTNETVDVGTGAKFQVPSLRGLAARAPFMHDGCAATVAARFSPKCGGGDKHGKTSNLTESQLADLSAYLETL